MSEKHLHRATISGFLGVAVAWLAGCGIHQTAEERLWNMLEGAADREALRSAQVVVLCDVVEKGDLAHYQVADIVRNRTERDFSGLVGKDLEGFGPDPLASGGSPGKHVVVFIQAGGDEFLPLMAHHFHGNPTFDEMTVEEFVELVCKTDSGG